VACVCAPSVYQKLKQGSVLGSDRVAAVVLEFDRRFAAYGDDFVFYDYNEPLALDAPRSFDVVLADPPYLSEECLSKVSQTVKHLSKGKVLLCTGESSWIPRHLIVQPVTSMKTRFIYIYVFIYIYIFLYLFIYIYIFFLNIYIFIYSNKSPRVLPI